MGKADEKVLKPAMQRGLIAGRTAFNKQIKSVYYVSPAVISRYSHIGYKKVEMRSDGLIGSIEYAGTVIPLIKYNVTPQKATYGKTPVKAAVKRSESQVELAKSFTAQMPNGHIGIYERRKRESTTAEQPITYPPLKHRADFNKENNHNLHRFSTCTGGCFYYARKEVKAWRVQDNFNFSFN